MKDKIIIILLCATLWLAYQAIQHTESTAGANMENDNQNLETATFAGGCFWCVESDFEKVDGVVEVISGYTGGHTENPSYEEVSSGGSGHLEAVQVKFNPGKVSYEALLDVFWRHVDPTDPGGQFVDRGPQYRTAIFYHDEKQKRIAQSSKEKMNASGHFDNPIVTEILELMVFYTAEAYHQDYYKRNPLRYKFYRKGSGRDAFLDKAWQESKAKNKGGNGSAKYARPADEMLRKTLTPLQYRVTRNDATEPPFDNTYWNNKAEGIYVDIVSGEPLFSSRDKFDSGTGWPSFNRPIEAENIVENKDTQFFAVRTEVRSRHGDSHLGHLFDDGPAPTGMRYCINSASLRFVPKENMAAEGYGDYLKLIEDN